MLSADVFTRSQPDFDGAPDRLATRRTVEPTYDLSSEKSASRQQYNGYC
jgi:hypothetical protein